MPFILIPERAAADLVFLSSLPSGEHVSEFCRVALEALACGMKKSTFKHAASALGVELEVVTGAIMALSLIFIEAAKVRPSRGLVFGFRIGISPAATRSRSARKPT